ncbi:MAG: DUF362 domain-containing protein [Planctomycetes bacterium]|nr:DUF362 domain-containing protein [Planctomycetota bacterium]
MGSVYDELVATLAVWRERYATRPQDEILRLLLLAVEREQVVTTGYRETAIRGRLEAMPISDEVRDLLRQALLWTWQDEEMHAVYVRGALLRLGRRLVTLRVALHQLIGCIGGWAGAVQQHLPWSRAPFIRLLAAGITGLGILSGAVPPAVRGHLRYQPFRDFCAFNVDAERTAALCFARLNTLLATHGGFPPAMLDDLRLVQEDEERHERLFALLAKSFTAEDRLADGVTMEHLVEAIGTISREFLPRAMRAEVGTLGSLTPVTVLEDPAAVQDPVVLLHRALAQAQVAELLSRRVQECGRSLADLRVAIKPSFMFAYHRDDPSPITDPRLVLALARWLRAQGVGDVAVLESPSVYDHFFRGRSVAEVAAYVGLTGDEIRLVDIAADQVPHRHGRGMGQGSIARTWKDADLRISFGKLRSHPIDDAMLTLSNLEWLGASHDDLLFAERQAHRQNATVMQIVEFPPHLALLDAVSAVPDGVVGMMGTRRALHPGRLYVGGDALAVDVVAARHLGIADPQTVLHLRTACTWLGVTRPQVAVHGCDTLLAGWRGPRHSGWSAFLCLLAFPLYVLASGRGTVFVPAMDEGRFPPTRPVGLVLRSVRRIVRRILGLRPSMIAAS